MCVCREVSVCVCFLSSAMRHLNIIKMNGTPFFPKKKFDLHLWSLERFGKYWISIRVFPLFRARGKWRKKTRPKTVRMRYRDKFDPCVSVVWNAIRFWLWRGGIDVFLYLFFAGFFHQTRPIYGLLLSRAGRSARVIRNWKVRTIRGIRMCARVSSSIVWATSVTNREVNSKVRCSLFSVLQIARTHLRRTRVNPSKHFIECLAAGNQFREARFWSKNKTQFVYQ